jgi:P pilus assembly chaperone PapD
MNVIEKKYALCASTLLFTLISCQAQAAIALDRTRAVFEGGEKSLSMSISNDNKQLPYLAQAWIEDINGKKIQTPLTIVPPLQRVEPGAKSQVKIQSLPAVNTLAQDRETLYYFNLREIPPRSGKPNTLQLALQTRIKVFYRPKALIADESLAPWQEKLTLTRAGDSYHINNPTPYYITISDGTSTIGGKTATGFQSLMLAPKSNETLKASAKALGNNPVLTYINDFGGRVQLKFTCNNNQCTANPVKS